MEMVMQIQNVVFVHLGTVSDQVWQLNTQDTFKSRNQRYTTVERSS